VYLFTPKGIEWRREFRNFPECYHGRNLTYVILFFFQILINALRYTRWTRFCFSRRNCCIVSVDDTTERRLQIIPHTIQYSDNITHFALHDVWHMSRVNCSVHHNVLPRRRIILRHIPWDIFRSMCEAIIVSKSPFVRYTIHIIHIFTSN